MQGDCDIGGLETQWEDNKKSGSLFQYYYLNSTNYSAKPIKHLKALPERPERGGPC
jgi:hypothetical protein